MSRSEKHQPYPEGSENKIDLCPDEAKALKGVELKATKQRLVMFGRVI